MQPTYLYASNFDREIRWRSRFSTGIPVLLGFFQLLLTFAIIGLEIVSVLISPIFGTLYAGFWSSVVFTLSWLFMIGLACCHRAYKWALFTFILSILCAATAITLIVLDALFIANITRCFFSNIICEELRASYPQLTSQPLGRKVLVLKAQLACAALMLFTAILYMLYFISVSAAIRRGTGPVLIERRQLPVQLVRQIDRRSPPPRSWKSTRVPISHDTSPIDCPNCGTSIKLTQKRRYS